MLLLNAKQIQQKVNRLAAEIVENNYNEAEIILAGINNNGMHFAKMLFDAISDIGITDNKITLTSIRLNPANPVASPITIDLPLVDLEDKAVVIVDDVINTGRTIQYAMKPLMDILPKKMEVAVLVERKHKAFPIKSDYVGLSLATTYMENIQVDIRKEVAEERAVYLN